jgi:hypothetical protein
MAEKVEIDIPGIGLIEAKNAATEATLLEILKVLEGTQKDINKNAKDQKTSGKGSAAGAADTDGLTQFNKQAKDSSKGINLLAIAGRTAGLGMQVLGRGANMAAGHVGFMAKMAVSTAGATFTLGKMAMGAATSMTSLIQELANVGDETTAAAAALGHIPVVGGLLAGVFGAVAAASENVVKSYQTAASVGATFGGSVQAMSAAAGGAGMTLDQFSNLIKNNSESLMLLGGTTEEGAKQFSKLAKGIQQSDVGGELQRLGFSTEQINGGMARYIGMLGKTGALQGMTTQQLVASSGAYMKELDALAKITGVSREAKEQEQQALMRDSKVRAAMVGLDAEQQKQMMSYITSFPKEQQGAIADMIATGNVTTEEAIKLQSMLPGVAQQTMQFGRTLQAGGRISQDTLNQAKNSAILEAKDSVKRNKQQGLYNAEAGATYVAMADLAAQKVDGYSQAIGEQAKATEKANLAENLTKAKQRLAEMSNGFQMALANSGALNGLMDVFSAFAGLIMSTVVPVFTNYIVPIITNFVVPALQAVFAIAGKIAAGLGMVLMPAIDAVSKALGPGSGLGGTVEFIDGILNAVFPPLAAIVRGAIMVFEGLLAGVSFLIAPIKRLFDAFGSLGDGSDLLTKIILYVGDYMGTVFKTMGFILGGVIDVAAGVVRWFGDLMKGTSELAGYFRAVGGAVINMIDVIRTYISPEGFKAMYASIKDFFQNGISDFFSSFKDAMLGMMSGMLQLLGKIPGLGKLAESGKEMEKEIEDRKTAREKAATERQKEINQLHKAAADQKTERDQKIQNHSSAIKQDSKAFSDKKIHLQSMGGLNQQEEDEKKKKLDAEKAENTTVDMSDPIVMLKSFAAKQKSAFTQEAAALEAKQKSESELKMANEEYQKAQLELQKAGSAAEKKAAEEKLKAASERVKKAAKADEETDETVRKAAERMKLAKQGKDPGAVAEGKAKDDKKTETDKGPESSGKPSGSSGPQEGVKTDGAMAKYLQTIALIESGGDKNAKAGTSSASGMFQFTEGTWKQMTKEMGKDYSKDDRFDPKKAAEVAEYFSKKQKAQIEKSTGREAGMTDMYMGHFLGAGGASKFLKAKDQDPNQSAAALDPAAAKANKNIYYNKEGKERTVQEVYDLMDKKVKAQSEKVEKGKVNADVAAIGGGSYKPGTKVDAVAEGKPKPQDGKTETKPESSEAKKEDKRTDKPVAAAETKKEETTQTPVGSMQSLVKDGIVPCTIAFQDLVKKGIMPMLTGTQVKGLDKSKEEKEKAFAEKDAKIKEAMAKADAEEARKAAATNDPRRLDKGTVKPEDSLKKGTVKPEDSLKKGEELVKATAEAQAKLAQAKITPIQDAKAVKPTETYTINGKPASKEEFDKFMKDNPELAKMMGQAPAKAQLKDPGTGELLSAAKDLSKSSEVQTALAQNKSRGQFDKESSKQFEAMAKILDDPLSSIADLSKIDLSKAVQPKNIKSSEFETPKAEIVAQKEKEAQEKAALEKQQAENRERLKQEEAMAMNGPMSQNNDAGAPIDLNTALAELIAISKRTADLNEKQLSVQSSLSGDLFA